MTWQRGRIELWALVFLLSLIPASIVQAQAPEMRFKRLTVDHGLSNNNVLALAQDRRGYIWIGTNDGLNKYDGYGFTTFRHDARDSTTLSNNGVSALLLDHAGQLWVGTADGLNLYHPSSDTFSDYFLQEESAGGPVSRRITALFEDRSNRLWVGTTAGLYLFDRDRAVFTRYDYEATAPSDFSGDRYRLNYVTVIYEDSQDQLWIGTASGLNLLNAARGTYSRFEFPAGAVVSDEVRDVAEDKRGNLWVATVRDGLYYVDTTSGRALHLIHLPTEPASLPSNSVRALHLGSDGTLLAGTSDGIGIYDADQGSFSRVSSIHGDETSLSFPSVRCILEDNQGNLWIGTWEGLNYFDRNSNHFVHFRRNPEDVRSLSDNIVSSFAEDPDGGIWIGTEVGGLNYVDPERHAVRVYQHDPDDPTSLPANNVKALHVDRSGDLWVGTHEGGLSRLDRGTGRFHNYLHDRSDSTGISGDRVYAIYEDRLGDLWIGTNKNGLNRLDQATNRFIRYELDGRRGGISSNEINAIYEDVLGNLWVGTAHGLNLFDRHAERFTQFMPRRDDPSSLIEPTVRTIFEDSRGNLWVGTSGGLELFDRRRQAFTHYTVREGLPNDAINCVLEDESSILWVSTNQGLSRFDPDRGTFRNFDIMDGIQSSQFNMNACLRDDLGRLYFGGVNGFSRFHPADITTNPLEPPVYITGLNVFNQPYPIESETVDPTMEFGGGREVVLRHDQNVVSIDFVAINYTVPSRNQYAYLLEGFEKEWNQVGTRRSATYTNLPPGRYTFRVKAANNDGVWNEAGAALQLRVLPPLWRTWWAYGLYALMLSAVLFGAYRYTTNLLRLKNRLALEQVRRKGEDELHAAKIQFFTNISHEFRTPLTLILGPLQEMLSSGGHDAETQEILRLIRRNTQRLLRLVNQLMDFRKLETDHMRLEIARTDVVTFVRDLALSFDDFARHSGVKFTVQSDYEGIYVWLDREKMETVFMNLLSNAFKFTADGGDVSVRIGSSGGHSYVAVSDTGIGLSEDELTHLFERFYQTRPRGGKRHGTGIGLALAKGIVELHGGRISVESQQGRGSTFTVELPLGDGHLRAGQCVSEEDGLTVQSLPDFHDEFEPERQPADAGSLAIDLGRDDDSLPLVLVIDDNKDMRTYIRSCLSSEYQVQEAADGVEGFHVAVENFPDLIVCDVMMPEMDGMSLCRKLKEDLRTSHIPILLLTARASTSDQVEGLETGADAYVSKPFESRLLLARIHNLIETRRKLRERFSLEIPIRPLDGGRSTRDDQFLRDVLEIIEDRISDSRLTVELLSQEVAMSRVYLHKKLKVLINLTPSDLIRTIRLKHGSRLLLEGALTVSEVAYQVGFNSPSHFATSFKKQYGQSPTDYAATFTAQRENSASE